jgi:hypothetical protein
MTFATVCPTHGLIPHQQRAAHRQLHEQQRNKQLAAIPWRFLYATPQWKRCLRTIKKRDGYRCRATEHGQRCRETTRLEGHHTPKLAELWDIADTRHEFIQLATDPRNVKLVCPTHNRRLDNQK